MLKSMTGFGKCENATDEYKISVEMKAVNHRYLDLKVSRCRRSSIILKAAIRTLLKSTSREVKWIFLSITKTIQKATSA